MPLFKKKKVTPTKSDESSRPSTTESARPTSSKKSKIKKIKVAPAAGTSSRVEVAKSPSLKKFRVTAKKSRNNLAIQPQ